MTLKIKCEKWKRLKDQLKHKSPPLLKSQNICVDIFSFFFSTECLLVEGQRDDIVLCDSNCPVTLSSVRIRFRIVWRQNQPTRTCQVPATWSYDKEEIYYSSLQSRSKQQWHLDSN